MEHLSEIKMTRVMALKDQILFVIFQLFMYIVDIGTDIYQAVEFYITGHPRRAMVTVFWILCPMAVKAVMDFVKWVKNYFNGGKQKECWCGLYACKEGNIQKTNQTFAERWKSFSLKNSFWCHLPFIQPFVHLTYFQQLRSRDNKISQNQQEFVDFRESEKFSNMSLKEKQEKAIRFGRNNNERLRSKKELLATFLELKMLEAFLEAGPQFVFQISVMMQDGISSYNQIFTIYTSAFSLIWASSELYLNFPTENYAYKESKFKEQVIIAFLMISNVLGRVLALAIVFAILKYYGIIPLVIMLIVLQVAATIESRYNQTKMLKGFLGILTSFISPCLIIKDGSKHMVVVGLVGSFLYLGMIWTLYFDAAYFRNIFPDSPVAIQCFHNISTDIIRTCPFNATSIEDCQRGFFAISNHHFFSACPESFDEWYFLRIACIIATVFLCISIFSVMFLHHLIDPVRRMMEATKVKINIWPEKNINIKDFVKQIMEGEDYEKVNEEAVNCTAKSLLELSVQSRLLHFTKRILFKIDPDISSEVTKKAFVLACQNQDLSILKLLIKKEKLKQKNERKGERQGLLEANNKADGNDTSSNLDNSHTTINETLLNAKTLEELLFDEKNIFIYKIIGKNSELSKYLMKVYKDETKKDFPYPGEEKLKNIKIQFDELDDTKFLYELQMQDGDIDLNMDLVSRLNLTNNVDLMRLNHLNHFSKIENMKTALINLTKNDNTAFVPTLMENYLTQIEFDNEVKRALFQASVNGRSTTLTAHFMDKFPMLMQDEKLFLFCEASNIFHTIKQFPAQFDERVVLKYIFRFFQYAVQQDKKGNIESMITKFPSICTDERLFEKCNGSQIIRALKDFPDKYQDPALHKFIKTAFIYTVKNSELSDDGSFLLSRFPRLSIDESLFEVDTSIETISTLLQTYPKEFRGNDMDSNLIEALNDSNEQLISSYIDTFSVLSRFDVAENMCKYAIDHSNISTIYQVIEKIPNLRQSKDELIMFLLKIDLRKTVIKPENQEFLKSIHLLNFALKHFPEQFGGKSKDTSLVQAFKESNIEVITDYLNSFQLLARHPFSEMVWKYALQKSNISAIYLLMEKVQGLHNSNLIQFLKKVDLRTDTVLPKDVNMSETDPSDCPPLHMASLVGATDIIRVLLSKGAKVNGTDLIGNETPLHFTSRGGHADVIRLLIQHKANIEAVNLVQWMPLHLVANKGYHEAAEILLHYGADPNAINDDGDTPLHKAAEGGHVKTVELLLKYKALKEEKDKNGRTPLEDAQAFMDDNKDSEKIGDYKRIIELLTTEVSS